MSALNGVALFSLVLLTPSDRACFLSALRHSAAAVQGACPEDDRVSTLRAAQATCDWDSRSSSGSRLCPTSRSAPSSPATRAGTGCPSQSLFHTALPAVR